MSKIDSSFKIVKAEEVMKNFEDIQIKKDKVNRVGIELNQINERIENNWRKISKSVITFRKYFMRTDAD